MDIYEEMKKHLYELAQKHRLLDEKVMVKGRALSTEEAIGRPQRTDYPLLKGKEKLLQAEFRGAMGQAFTDSPYSFYGRLEEMLEMPCGTNFEKAAFVAVLNAVMRYLGLAEGTIHCKDEEPEECAEKLAEDLKNRYGTEIRIGMIGFQPAFLEGLSKEFNMRLVDLDPDNIGKEKFGVRIEDAKEKTEDLLKWADVLLATGSTVANGTITDFLNLDIPVIFFGTTIAGAARIFGFERFCCCSK